MDETDLSMKERVQEKLLYNGEVDSHNFEIEVERGVVKVEGEVPSRHAKKVVDECLKTVSGIRHVENKLKIRRVAHFSDNSSHGF